MKKNRDIVSTLGRFKEIASFSRSNFLIIIHRSPGKENSRFAKGAGVQPKLDVKFKDCRKKRDRTSASRCETPIYPQDFAPRK